ncbi:MAG: hypothetical protein JW744_00330 [Candidatus Diapherotrites archaeon]|uniref:Uncharacterized protein n=1 Tax=Candidatus Iainarchaeum sp. TaxID=3101447 RepID=A0A938YRU6_9ARCH|nr:hypothetical protein [Candidatus Diapherotrites archaeon]
MNQEMMVKTGTRVLILAALILALLFVLTFTGIMKCNQIPVIGGAWCNVYWFIKTIATGSPKVLIVYGDYGLGNPFEGEGSLKELLSNPSMLGVYADTMPVERVSLGNLRGYDIVIVERARKIETVQMRAFIDYATGPTGGTLIWTGDAGTELGPKDRYLYTTDRNPDADINKVIGPWARRDGDYMISFDYLLGVESPEHNYCDIASCSENAPVLAGNMETEPSGSHPLIRGLSRSLPLYVFKGEDFAIVKTLSGGITTEVLSLDFGARLVSADLNRSVPLIVTAGLGERAIYYALPPEYYANPRLAENGKSPYFVPVENMYYGVIKG